MNEYEVRIFELDGVWTDWFEASNHKTVDKLFQNIYINAISYTYRDGSIIEYRKK